MSDVTGYAVRGRDNPAMTVKLGELRYVTPRQVWPDEARDFTPWIASNIGHLSDALGMELELTAQEASVGDFSCDVLARDMNTNHIVIIENQFGSTNHDHLGKLITYAAGLEATGVVWIAEKIREEHRQAVEWLNRHTDSDLRFFIIIVEALQIDDSPIAVNFKPVVFPNEWQRAAKESADGTTPKGEAYRRFFTALIDELREHHRFTNARAGQPQNWYSFRSGITGVDLAVSFGGRGKVRVEAYIDLRDEGENKSLFDELQRRRESIENAIGETLSWERLDEKRASRIATYHAGDVTGTPDDLAEIRTWAIDRLLLFRKVFTPILKEILGSRRNALVEC